MTARRRINIHTLIAQEEQDQVPEQNQLPQPPPQMEAPHRSENNTPVPATLLPPAAGNTSKPLKQQTSKPVVSEPVKPGKNEEKLITKISVYLEDEPYIEKLDSLKKQYRKRTRKGTDYNKILRILIKKATIEDLL